MSIVLEQTIVPEAEAQRMGRVVVIIPACNDERLIGSVVLQAGRMADSVIVVDDGSADKTAAVAATAGATVIPNEINAGKANAPQAGFVHAHQIGADVVVMLTANGRFRPAQFQATIDPILTGDADIVVYSRCVRRVDAATQPGRETAVSEMHGNIFAFSRRAIEKLLSTPAGAAFASAPQRIAAEHHLQLVEISVPPTSHQKPNPSYQNHSSNLLNSILRLTGQYRPLLFFGVSGTALLLVGFGWGLWMAELYRHTHELAVGYALICVMLFIIGNIILSTGIILHSVRGLLLRLSPNPL